MYRKTPAHLINVAATEKKTTFLGPGLRCALWVRGCYANCPGCIAPDWQSPMPENFCTVSSLVNELIVDNHAITGISISGGEPFLQAEVIANFVIAAKQHRDLDVLIYSGYTLEKLSDGTIHGAKRLLSLCDVLIDGRYNQTLNQDRGLYGSTNQHVHYLTDRLRDYDFNQPQRKVEFRYNRGEIFLVGVPGKAVAGAFFTAVTNTRHETGDSIQENLLEESDECK